MAVARARFGLLFRVMCWKAACQWLTSPPQESSLTQCFPLSPSSQDKLLIQHVQAQKNEKKAAQTQPKSIFYD